MEKGKGEKNAVETAVIAASTLKRRRCDLVNSTVNYICTKAKQSMDITISHYMVSQHLYSVLSAQRRRIPKIKRVY
jgi:hypothetical protein